MDKKLLRSEMNNKLKGLEEEFVNDTSKKIVDVFVNSKFYENSKTIACFVSFKNEIGTHPLIEKMLEDKKTVLVPITNSVDRTMVFSKISSFDELKLNSMGILEPVVFNFIDPETIDIFLTPGLAFDHNGNRLGRGAGYYDKYFMGLENEIYKLALGYSFQLIDEVPSDEHDIKVDGFMSEKGIVEFRRNLCKEM